MSSFHSYLLQYGSSFPPGFISTQVDITSILVLCRSRPGSLMVFDMENLLCRLEESSKDLKFGMCVCVCVCVCVGGGRGEGFLSKSLLPQRCSRFTGQLSAVPFEIELSWNTKSKF